MRMWESQRHAEVEYQTKLELALNGNHIDKLHPMRKAQSGRNRSRPQMSDILGQ